jgi:dolichol-phosphate mannosyltransferase|tara:strand:+ start:3979 stop:4698 length:720 start_codon:yes stop_codon:yes gene_type:complete
MNCVPLEIIVPVFNEGEKVVKLMKNFELHVSTNFRVLFCYDDASDNIFDYKNELSKFKFEIVFIKNVGKGPLSAIKEGFRSGNSDCVIVYPADDFLNFDILDTMYQKFVEGSQIVVASRFIKGGSMNNCPLIKSILVRVASYTLYYLSSIPAKDASNGFRLFSRKLLNEVKIESQVGFAYSLELLAKCNRLKYKISEVPAKWEERSEGQSRFKVLKWLPQYLKWYIYGISTTWLRIKKL